MGEVGRGLQAPLAPRAPTTLFNKLHEGSLFLCAKMRAKKVVNEPKQTKAGGL